MLKRVRATSAQQMKVRERLLHERACVSVERTTDGGWNTKERRVRGREDRQLNIES
jgi:hypothetical protein